jgi:hypothetical protein
MAAAADLTLFSSHPHSLYHTHTGLAGHFCDLCRATNLEESFRCDLCNFDMCGVPPAGKIPVPAFSDSSRTIICCCYLDCRRMYARRYYPRGCVWYLPCLSLPTLSLSFFQLNFSLIPVGSVWSSCPWCTQPVDSRPSTPLGGNLSFGPPLL